VATTQCLTQIQLAEMIDSTQRAISRYETVADRAPAPVLAKLAKALRVTTDELLRLKPVRSANGHDDLGARRLWKKFQQVMVLPEKDQPGGDPAGQLPRGDEEPLGGRRVKRRPTVAPLANRTPYS